MTEFENQGSKEIQEEPPAETTAGQPQEADRLAEAEKQIAYYKDMLLRKVAEFDNYKKRAESETSSILKYGKADTLQGLLPIIDDFERSLKLGKDTRETDAFAKGVDLIYQKLVKYLDSQGIKPIDSLGKEFDVHYHDALLQIPRSDVPPHTVVEVVEKGYMMDDRVLRHAKVVVSAHPPEGESPRPEPPPSEPPTQEAR